MVGPDIARIEVVRPYGPAITVKVRITTGDRVGQLHGTLIHDLGEVDPISKLGGIFTKMLADEKADEEAKKADEEPEAPDAAQLSNPAIAAAAKPTRRTAAANFAQTDCDCPCHDHPEFIHAHPCCPPVAAKEKDLTLGVLTIEFRVKIGRLERSGVEGLGTDRPDDTYCPICDHFGHAENSPACELFGEYGQR